MKTFVSVVALVAVSQAKFCPGERGGNKCVAKDNSYKCAVFFENLTPKRDLTWIGALPDALKKAKNQQEVKEILGDDVNEESFSQLTTCDEKTANARCYTILDRQRSIKLDSCDRNLINTRGSETIGDYLCGQVRRWLRRDDDFKANGIRNLRLPFYYSACNGDWTPISDGSKDLYFDEPLCCTPEGTYFSCDGSAFNSVC
eukprot:TRINITY_DN4812_c0_g1_i1.p1 TRINITY_DN4812_c0_g1~~TRINITY_DN4812_c0_g1_i1.p1  ORF type:complete len:201 (-),score=50.51 TRINITY_DN4812_c0_g1_i1:35-637(-)